MKKPPIPEPDLQALLSQALRDDLPPETEARMNRHFIGLKRALDQPEREAESLSRERWFFRKELLAFASAFMLILGAVLHLSGGQSALANSVSRLKLLVEVSSSLRDAAYMDCTVTQPAGGKASRYRVRWGANGITRVDRDTIDGVRQTLWISNTNVPPDPVWQPAMEFLMPRAIADNMENRYGLMQTARPAGYEPDEFLLVGRENQRVVEIAVDRRTFLPKALKKCLPHGKRGCVVEVRFLWDQPIPRELLLPGSAAQ